ncbi:DNA-binding transcriptional response regulator, NtrC family, contains REC, AAA-type ATPase, and a Fis-type DNA-binding domains [Reichenbachiella faecimaris]|uniref:DNA-binding transcriptional response regulator, NtrC family, contains REC, AAA-type ATPase, and a Fis-type DNA-binding domains n=1 Tax=Reichenbachiella faecimaris TaxID=692418 RepID=A0A1W2G6K2_REIFA|nr:sigma-54 dependent transcriptional regulator [Reichenbachiella faecimaris]SMD32144.1 DNA-binding transcriptional response regulator, NtrC family, contains REC, AAA-type ATPase, and a Fis-type DNA-binding domains [Reichenbachiella faecimaris]
MTKILIIDDEKSIRHTLREILEYEKYHIDEAENGKAGLDKLKEEDFDLVLCDVKMPEMDGIEVLENARTLDHTPQFIMISAHATIDTAVDATKKGAFDFIQKPPDLNRLLLTIKNALDKSNLIQETKVLKKKVAKSLEIVGESRPIQEVKETIEKVASTEARVLITGENGTGKELVANAIHKLSNRNKKPLIEVNCAAIPAELIESELFGHEKGSFTSAVKQRIGKFELADNGTLFLDEIGDMSLSAQAKVLRALQENKITRVGGEKEIKVNVRVLAATNKNLKEEINQKRFREDLYHRLSVILIKVPSLKERVDDIPMLVDKFLGDIAAEYGTSKKEIDEKALDQLKKGNWTGNIRELRNVVERLIIMSDNAITATDVKKYADTP